MGAGDSSPSSSPCDGFETNVAAEIEAVHKGDSHAELYGRIVGWNGSHEGLFRDGTLGASVSNEARDVVLAMLRPRAEDRVEGAEVLNMPWLASSGPGDA